MLEYVFISRTGKEGNENDILFTLECYMWVKVIEQQAANKTN